MIKGVLFRYNFVLFFFFFSLIFGAAGMAYEGMITSWEEFVVKRELELHALNHVMNYQIFSFPGHEKIPFESGTSVLLMGTQHEKPGDNSTMQRIPVGRVKVSFSRIMKDGYRLDPADLSADSQSTLEAFKSMTTILRSGTYRDSFEFFGKTFEPQINLSIEF